MPDMDFGGMRIHHTGPEELPVLVTAEQRREYEEKSRELTERLDNMRGEDRRWDLLRAEVERVRSELHSATVRLAIYRGYTASLRKITGYQRKTRRVRRGA